LAYHLNDETNKLRPEENEIIRIAWEAVERRREAATKRGKQLQINGTVQENGYAVYKDYNQYMEEKKQQLPAPPWMFSDQWQHRCRLNHHLFD